MEPVRIGVILGDGIGPDVVGAAVDVTAAALERHGIRVEFEQLPAGLTAVESHGSALPPETLERLALLRGWILGPMTTHVYRSLNPPQVNPSGYLRKHFDLYANVRPARAFPGVTCVRPETDVIVVRENTEGFYADRNTLDGQAEFRPDPDTVLSLRVVTRRASLRVAQQAFRLASSPSRRGKVTAVHKANVLARGDGLFLQCCREVAGAYPGVTLDDLHVDACAARMVTHPQEFDVIVTTNMFGDILSDLAAGLAGGLGMAPGLNVGDRQAMAQATHGSAPDIADLHCANPVAEILSAALLLEWLAGSDDMGPAAPGLRAAAADVQRAVGNALERGEHLTPDLGGQATTYEMTEAILRELSGL